MNGLMANNRRTMSSQTMTAEECQRRGATEQQGESFKRKRNEGYRRNRIVCSSRRRKTADMVRMQEREGTIRYEGSEEEKR